jgi:hypothetical protein
VLPADLGEQRASVAHDVEIATEAPRVIRMQDGRLLPAENATQQEAFRACRHLPSPPQGGFGAQGFGGTST